MARRSFAGFLKYFSTPLTLSETTYAPKQGAIVSVQSKHYSDSAILLEGLKEVRQGQLISLNSGQKAWVVALMRDYVGAVVLGKDQPSPNIPAAVVSGKLTLAVGAPLFGKVHSSLTRLISEEKGSRDLLAFLKQKLGFPSKKGAAKWLTTGYFHIDLFTPMALGQMVCFKGKKNAGKTTVSINTIRQFLVSSPENHAIFVATNPYTSASDVLRLAKDPVLGERLAVYTSAEDGAVGQFLMPYAALMNAAHMKAQGKNVLFVLDDALYQAKTCISAFAAFQPYFSPLGFLNLCFDHSRSSPSGSLTSVVIVHENTEDDSMEYRTLTQHLEGIVDRTVAFQEAEPPMKGSLPSIDFRHHRDRMQSLVQWGVFKHVARKLSGVLDTVVIEQKVESERKHLGIYTAPWDKYLLLDSQYFLRLMLCGESLTPGELLLFSQFLVYTIEHGEH